jgi:hypothetical protein
MNLHSYRAPCQISACLSRRNLKMFAMCRCAESKSQCYDLKIDAKSIDLRHPAVKLLAELTFYTNDDKS